MYAASLLNRHTLVLNRNWVPIQTTTIRQALGLVANGAARIIDPRTYEVHDLHSWHDVSSAAERLASLSESIRSMRLRLAPPEVIVLTRYRGAGNRRVVFTRRNLFRRDRCTCQYCGARPGTGALTIDHLLPRSRGGKSTWENCAVACLKCNGRKADRTPAEARLRLRRRPRAPRWSAIYRVPGRLRRESWRNFVSEAYWEVELEP